VPPSQLRQFRMLSFLLFHARCVKIVSISPRADKPRQDYRVSRRMSVKSFVVFLGSSETFLVMFFRRVLG